ncbi:MAG: recombination mediator RecR [Patescibacteria group bacterium]|jgi:recombination protein RecR
MLPTSIQKLIDQLGKLPGIGPKTASRLAFFLLKKPQADLETFANSITHAKADIITCSICLDLAQTNPCRLCSNPERDQDIVCVVAESHDLQAIERTGEYQGVYHVLGGILNPLEGIGPESLNIRQLLSRTQSGKIKEIILGLNPDLEGESTSLYLQKLLQSLNLKITRLAKGLPSGSDIEYADEITLGSALKNRREV